mmetsp:Transcript_1935/g.2620  ORF Transcript_1935/g.2620 Transcript_1935/m.2620 type:complete len:89 (-) Transcript_1935:290-556(-)
MSSTLPSITVTENDNEPSWMSEETPLMGTGTLDLEDPRPPWHDEEDDDEEEEEEDDDDDDFDFQQKKQQQQQQTQRQITTMTTTTTPH